MIGTSSLIGGVAYLPLISFDSPHVVLGENGVVFPATHRIRRFYEIKNLTVSQPYSVTVEYRVTETTYDPPLVTTETVDTEFPAVLPFQSNFFTVVLPEGAILDHVRLIEITPIHSADYQPLTVTLSTISCNTEIERRRLKSRG